VRQLAEQVIDLVARRGGPRSGLEVRPLPEDDPKQRRPDITRARATLGWEPTVPLREGLVRTVAYFAELLAADGAHASRTLDDVPARAPVSA
jgi:UDP-glucuronate decarboxylase